MTARFDGAAWATASRAAQGLPPAITDPAVLARVAEILVGARRDDGAPSGAATDTFTTTATSTAGKRVQRVQE